MRCLFFLVLFLLFTLTSLRAQKPFEKIKIEKSGLTLDFEISKEGFLRFPMMLPTGFNPTQKVILQDKGSFDLMFNVTGESTLDHYGSPGDRLRYIGKTEKKNNQGHQIIFEQFDDKHKLKVESFYEFNRFSPVIRRYSKVTNNGKEKVGIEFLSSAIINNYNEVEQGRLMDNIRLHWAYNSHVNEAQWVSTDPDKIGRSQAFFPNQGIFKINNVGSMSTRNYLPMGMIENIKAGLTWFWQIEHSGSWVWRYGDVGVNEDHHSKSSYVYIGGPDVDNGQAWKELLPGETYQSVPVAIGVVEGGFEEASAALTNYRRNVLVSNNLENNKMPVFFNDYMHCLWANPTTESVLPLVDAAANLGCDYYVMDAGWYGEIDESWYDKVGSWKPALSRFPKGLNEVMDYIRKKGMKPGIWLEIEVAGVNSILKDKPDSWFMMMHGKRIQDNDRYLLDFRNPEVTQYLDQVVDELVSDYGIQFFKIDYNSKIAIGTDYNSNSPGQGLLEHTKRVIDWYVRLQERHPNLIIESCSSGGNRLDYGILSHVSLTSSSDQIDYRKVPSIVVGEMAAVLPEQIGIWSYPQAKSNAEEASFNMVNSMLGRIYLGGEIASLTEDSHRQVKDAILIYKNELSMYVNKSTPFFPLGLPSIGDNINPVALGLKSNDKSYIAIWRLNGEEDSVKIPLNKEMSKIRLVYPNELGIKIKHEKDHVLMIFPKTYMAGIIELQE